MKQPEDSFTMDLLEPGKRGRGRPRLINRLSDAERARRYRAKKRKAEAAHQNIREVSQNHSATVDAFDDLRTQKAQLLEQVIRLQQDLAAMCDAVDLFIEYRQKKRTMPADIFRNVCQGHLKVMVRLESRGGATTTSGNRKTRLPT